MFRRILAALTILHGCTANADQVQLALNWKAEPQFGGFYAAQVDGRTCQCSSEDQRCQDESEDELRIRQFSDDVGDKEVKD